MTTTRQRVGKMYEDLAAAYLVRQGYEVLERNYRCPYGEIDLIAKDRDGSVVFIEVKGRKNRRFGYGGEAVTPLKQQRIRQTAHIYIQQKRWYVEGDFRFDAIIFENEKMAHIKNAF